MCQKYTFLKMFYTYKLTIVYLSIFYIYIYTILFTIATMVDLSQYRCFSHKFETRINN